MRVDLFDFDLPAKRIALRPAEPRDAARLLVVRPRAGGGAAFEDRGVRDLTDLLQRGDILVTNDTRVIPAQLQGRRIRGAASARIDATLHKREGANLWRAFVRPFKKLKAGEAIGFEGPGHETLDAEVVEKGAEGEVLLRFSLSGGDLDAAIERVGRVPLPPYISGKRAADERDAADYQTLFAQRSGAVAAPTASLHFTPALVAALTARGVAIEKVTLHVGAGTFLPVKAEDTRDHRMHAEWGEVSAATAKILSEARRAGRRIVAAGTTSLRILEIGRAARRRHRRVLRRDLDLHYARLRVPRGGRSPHQFSSAALDTVHARLRFLRSRGDARGLCSCDRAELSILQLWRCLPVVSRAGAGMSEDFRFEIAATDGAARAGAITLPRGSIRTPAFMPVGTAATVKAMHPEAVKALGADIVLANTYHLMLRPGAERIAALGGLHRFMNWPGPILTDSGGFQVMSLAKLRKLDEKGVTFQSHIDGSTHVLTPERSMEIQDLLDADIQMQFDECVKLPCAEEEARRAMLLSLRWAERSKKAFAGKPGRALFGIVQGGASKALRIESARALVEMDFEGYALGGLAVGEPQDVMLAMIDYAAPELPADKPRYLMGVGAPDDLVEAVRRGIDMFDCVMPTRAGRHGLAYTRAGKLNLRNARHADDPAPVDAEACNAVTRTYARAYLHHLVKSGEILGMMLLTEINLAYYEALMADLRAAISAGRLDDFIAETKDGWLRGDESES